MRRLALLALPVLLATGPSLAPSAHAGKVICVYAHHDDLPQQPPEVCVPDPRP
jgi:hypothetical protein